MAIAHVNTQVGSPNGSGGTTQTSVVTKPTGLAVGDLMLAFVAANKAGMTAPSGFTQIGSEHDSSANAYSSDAYYKVATSGDVAASNFTFTNGDNSSPMIAVIMAYRGVDTTSPINASNFTISTGTTAGKTCPSVTTTASCMVVRSLFVRLTSGTTNFSSTVTNERFDNGNRSTVGYWGAGYDAGSENSAGSTGTATITVGTNGNMTDAVSYTVALATGGTEVDLGAGSVAAASTTANDATVLIQTVQAATSSTAAYDASVDQKVNAAVAGATTAAYDGLRPAFASVGNVDTQAYSTSLHLDVNADVAEVTAGVVNAIAYYGASKVRMFQVPPENRTFMVRR